MVFSLTTLRIDQKEGFKNFFAISPFMTNLSSCHTMISDFSQANLVAMNATVTATNLTIEYKDSWLHCKDALNSQLKTTFDQCQTDHKYIWIHAEVEQDASFLITTVDCNENERNVTVTSVNNTWSTECGSYTDGFLIKADEGIKSFWLSPSVAAYKVKKTEFMDCPLNATVYPSVSVPYSTEVEYVEVEELPLETQVEPMAPVYSSNWTNITECGNTTLYPSYEATPIMGTPIVAPTEVYSPIEVGTPISAPTEVYSPIEVGTPIAAATQVETITTGTPITSEWTKYTTRSSMMSSCQTYSILTPSSLVLNNTESINSTYTMTPSSSIAVPIPYNVTSASYIEIDYSCSMSAFTIDLGYKQQRVVVPDNRERSLLLDIRKVDVDRLIIHKMNQEVSFTLKGIKVYHCELSSCSTTPMLINDFTGTTINKQGYKMSTDNSCFMSTGNGSLALSSNSTGYFYTNVGSPCMSLSTSMNEPALVLKGQGSFTLQLEYADDCNSTDRSLYSVVQVPVVLDTEVYIPLLNLNRLFSVYVMDFTQVTLYSISVVELGCEDAYTVEAPGVSGLPLQSTPGETVVTPTIPSTPTSPLTPASPIEIPTDVYSPVEVPREVVTPVEVPAVPLVTENPTPTIPTTPVVPVPMESLEPVPEDPVYPVEVDPQEPMATETEVSDVWLNDFKHHHYKNKRGYKMGCDDSGTTEIKGTSLTITPVKKEAYWYTNVGDPCIGEKFDQFKVAGVELALKGNGRYKVHFEYSNDCSTKDRSNYEVDEHVFDLNGEESKKWPIRDNGKLFSIYLMNVTEPVVVESVKVVECEE